MNSPVPFSFNVVIINLPPAFTSDPVAQVISGGQTNSYLLPSANDPEGAIVVITLIVNPTWVSVDGSTLTMAPKGSDIGTHFITV